MAKKAPATQDTATYWRTAIAPNHPLPDGADETEYQSYQDWSKEQWAWEFLRRNKKFQAECDRLARQNHLTPEALHVDEYTIARKYGLKKFKPWNEKYGEKEAQQPEFAAPHTKVNLKGKSIKNFSVTILDGQALVLFDLKLALKDEQFLARQLEKTKDFLASSLEKYRTKSGAEISTIRPKIPSAKILIKYLRLLDLVRSRRKSLPEIFAEFYPGEIKEANGNRHKNDELRRKLKGKMRTPNSYVDEGYLRIGAAPPAERKN